MVLPLRGGKSLCPRLPSCELGISQVTDRPTHDGGTEGAPSPGLLVFSSLADGSVRPLAPHSAPPLRSRGQAPRTRAPCLTARPGFPALEHRVHTASWGAGAHLPRACPVGQPPPRLPPRACASLLPSPPAVLTRPPPSSAQMSLAQRALRGPCHLARGRALPLRPCCVWWPSPPRPPCSPRPPISPHPLILPADPERLPTLLAVSGLHQCHRSQTTHSYFILG